MDFFLDPSVVNNLNLAFLQDNYEVRAFSDAREDEVFFVFDNDVLQIKQIGLKPIYTDYLSPQFLREVRQGYGRTEAIFKFLRAPENLRILDLTLGFGKDFFKAVLCGHSVLGLERNRIVFELVKDGMRRFNESSESEVLREQFKVDSFKPEIQCSEALDFLKTEDLDFDMIFYDPMFEVGLKVGKAKKNMQFLRKFLSVTSEDESLSVISSVRERMRNLDERSEHFKGRFVLKAASDFKYDKSEVKSVYEGKGFKFLVY